MILRVNSGGSGNDIVVASRGRSLATAYWSEDGYVRPYMCVHICIASAALEQSMMIDEPEYSRKKGEKPSRLCTNQPSKAGIVHFIKWYIYKRAICSTTTVFMHSGKIRHIYITTGRVLRRFGVSVAYILHPCAVGKRVGSRLVT